jgi:hypothetical protein
MKESSISGDQAATLGQGAYYVASGIWPLLSIGSFQRVSGPKTDVWLVKTVATLIAVVGGTLTVSAVRRQDTPEMALLSMGSAAGLLAIDVVYVAKRRISPIYLLDALAEALIIGARLRGKSRPAS